MDEEQKMTEAVSEETENAVLEAEASEQWTAEEKKAIADVVAKIDFAEPNRVARYGAAAQKIIGEFAAEAVNFLRTKSFSSIETLLGNIVSQLKEFEAPDESTGLRGFFRKLKGTASLLRDRFEAVSVGMAGIGENLKKQQELLTLDKESLDELEEKAASYRKMLTMYIQAGQMKLEEAKETLVELFKKAKLTQQASDAQAARVFEEAYGALEKKLRILEQTRTLCEKIGEKLAKAKENDDAVAENLQIAVLDVIPQWKKRIATALGLEDDSGNADVDKVASTNEKMRSTVEDMRKVREEATETRRALEGELASLAEELKTEEPSSEEPKE